MRAHGWALNHIAPDASDVDGATFDDMRGTAKGQRGNAALHADARKCNPSGRADYESPKVKQCMLNRGWRLSFVVAKPNPTNEASASSASNPWADHNFWVDARKRGRGDAAARADANYCIGQTGPDYVGQETSPALKQCMLSRGWRFDHTERSPTWIDPETGLSCRSAGIAAICDPPQGSYVNKHGYPCRRTGLISVCSNL
jgi:hypothetical protein